MAKLWQQVRATFPPGFDFLQYTCFGEMGLVVKHEYRRTGHAGGIFSTTKKIEPNKINELQSTFLKLL